MSQSRTSACSGWYRSAGLLRPALLILAMMVVVTVAPALAQTPAAPPASAAPHAGGGEASLRIPDLAQVQFLGVGGRPLLMFGLVVCVLGLVFGLVIYGQLKRLPVHSSMREISELIYETCKTYLITQRRMMNLPCVTRYVLQVS